MSIDDELNEHLNALQLSGPSVTKEVREGERLVREVRETCVQIARALWDRRVPVLPIMVRSPQPSSRLVHFFKGPDSNPLVKAADGWEIIPCFCIDTTGKIWQTGTGEDEWVAADIAWWEDEFSRVMNTEPFVYISGNYLTRKIDDDGDSWIEMQRMTFNNQGHRDLEPLPVREALLKGAAELIAKHAA